MKLIIFSILLSATAVFSHAQTRVISGIVLDARNISALPHVKVEDGSDTTLSAYTNSDGVFHIQVPAGKRRLLFSLPQYKIQEQVADTQETFLKIFLEVDNINNSTVVVNDKSAYTYTANPNYGNVLMPVNINHAETYDRIIENSFAETKERPLSTFALNVDRASYSNVRRFINRKQPVPPEIVRIEELINYFPYHYRPPAGNAPLALYATQTTCPWQRGHRLLRVAVKAGSLKADSLPPCNLVFLIDVSGSMDHPDRLPLLQAAFRLLINNLREDDHVAMVVYAGAAGLVLPSTPCSQRQKILDALDNLRAGGSTAGGAGLRLAYDIALKNFIPRGNNRVILATDGDFNVGLSSDEAMKKLIGEMQQTGIQLTCLGVGMGNYKDSKLQTLALWGKGNFAYIDNLEEAEKVLGKEFTGTLFTVARDAGLKVIFNPAIVRAYRLIGYENRIMKENDSIGWELWGGDIGSGLAVTAFYELVPADTAGGPPPVRDLAVLSLQYTPASGDSVHYLRQNIPDTVIPFEQSDTSFRFAAAVALWGLLLRDSHYKGTGSPQMVEAIAREAIENKKQLYRKEFLKLVKSQEKMSRKNRGRNP